VQPTPKHTQVEARFRDLLDDAELPGPDRIEYPPGSVVFRWDGPQLAVVIDFDGGDQDSPAPSSSPRGISRRSTGAGARVD
jgi:hypothetical protein